MKILIIYDSFFGNTEKIARAMTSGFDSTAEITILRVGEVNPKHLAGLNLLIVGSPTRGFSASEATRKFLKDIPDNALKGVATAAFDTRMVVKEVNNPILTFMAGLFGYAASPIDKALVKKGGRSILAPEGFFVQASEGPLKDGELERAENWVRSIKI